MKKSISFLYLVPLVLYLIVSLSCGGGSSNSGGSSQPGCQSGYISGSWSGDWYSVENPGQGGNLTANLCQSGTQVSGTVTITGTSAGTVTGNVTGTLDNIQGPGHIEIGTAFTLLGNFTFRGSYTNTNMSGDYYQSTGGNDYGYWSIHK